MKRKRGFSLVETIVAVALLGVGISACVACMGAATRASARAEEYTAVQLLAREKLTELELTPPQEGQETGDFGEERPGFFWQTTTVPTDIQDLREVRLEIVWGDPENPRKADFVTLVREQ